jgi:hypothetical protein
MSTQSKLDRFATWGLVVVLAASLLIVAVFTPGLIPFAPMTVTDVVNVITPLFLVALFIERGLEVFLTSWRAGESQRRADSNDAAGLREHKIVTQRLAFLAGTAVGVIISALGVRALQPLVYADLFPGADGVQLQERVFMAMDVLLTGLLLGGGADGLHKIVTVFTNFMDATAQQAKRRGET